MLEKMIYTEFKSVLDCVRDGILVYGEDGHILLTNKKAQNIFGLSDKQMTAKTKDILAPVFIDEDLSEIKDQDFLFGTLASTKKEGLNRIVGIRKYSQEYIGWYRVSAKQASSDGLFSGKIIVSFSEINSSRDSRAESVNVEALFKQLIKNSFDMLVLIDSNGIQHFVSESCERILGYRPEELVNIPVIEEMVHPEDREKTRAEFRNVVKDNKSGKAEYRHRHKNGGWVYLEAFGTNQINNPDVRAVVLNVRDITERKEAEQKLKENELRLQELNATKDKFFSIIAHDLKGPFHSIIGFSDLLESQIRDKNYQDLDRYTAIIRHSSQMALDLLINLLEWSHSQTGRIKFNPEHFDLVALINKIIKLFIDSASQKLISISLVLPVGIPVFADKGMLGTVLRNLISNSVKFTNPGGEIIISSEVKDDLLIVAVADNGVGMPQEAIDKLFRIEESFSTPGTNNEKGTGLGLFLCQEFMKKHDGELWVESWQGEGSTFRFAIPHVLA